MLAQSGEPQNHQCQFRRTIVKYTSRPDTLVESYGSDKPESPIAGRNNAADLATGA